jgi:hypothetical protein
MYQSLSRIPSGPSGVLSLRGGCFFSEGVILQDRSVIYSWESPSWHELVHAVESYGIGIESWVLQEGLADYVGRGYSTSSILKDFPSLLKADLERDLPSSDYRAATHFVGSLIERHGIPRFKQFCARVGRQKGLAGFSEAYLQEFDVELDAALTEMSLTPITGRATLDCTGEALHWTNPGELRATLSGACGDEQYYRPGSTLGAASAFRQYIIDVSETSMYEFSLTSTSPGTTYGQLLNCELPLSAWRALKETRTVPLQPGRHLLRVGFPDDAGVQGELELRLTRFVP